MITVALFLACSLCTAAQPATDPQGPSVVPAAPSPAAADSARAPLEAGMMERIERWRRTLSSAQCIKIVEDAERRSHRDQPPSPGVDPASEGSADHVSRVEGHAWMLRDALWLVIYPSRPSPGPDPIQRDIDRSRPDVQLLWRHGTVFERVWDKSLGAYRVRSYPCTSSSGPGDFDYGENCSLGDISESWLAPGSSIVKSIGLEYSPEARVTPPALPGPTETWITLGIDQCKTDPKTGKILYSRIDDVLFDARDQVKEWCTRVVNNMNGDGRVTARRRYRFEFLGGPPEALVKAMDDFESLVQGHLADSSPTQEHARDAK